MALYRKPVFAVKKIKFVSSFCWLVHIAAHSGRQFFWPGRVICHVRSYSVGMASVRTPFSRIPGIKSKIPFQISCLGVPLAAGYLVFWWAARSTNRNSDKTLFIAFNNCHILSLKNPQTLENTKFIASEFAPRLPLVSYPFPSCYELS